MRLGQTVRMHTGKIPRGHDEKTATYKPGGKLQNESSRANILSFNFYPHNCGKNKFLLFKPPRQWYFISLKNNTNRITMSQLTARTASGIGQTKKSRDATRFKQVTCSILLFPSMVILHKCLSERAFYVFMYNTAYSFGPGFNS